jgi:hypothetical protein
LSDAERAKFYIRVAQAYLKAEDDVNADRFVRRADGPVNAAGDSILKMQYRACYAQMLDQKRKFLEAAMRYIELTQVSADIVDDADLLALLEKAVKCAILAPAGPQRQRVMGTLYRDSRIDGVDVSAADAAEPPQVLGGHRVCVAASSVLTRAIHFASRLSPTVCSAPRTACSRRCTWSSLFRPQNRPRLSSCFSRTRRRKVQTASRCMSVHASNTT